ncbi:TPA: DUF460 domain-containing protein [Candidatus Micrarchaeota archaeon]|nr:DUF460 domain-containing protein [Candidatus Micrarchaeota archaeon]
MIVGIDPGIKVGYAVIDLNGKLTGAGCVKQRDAGKIAGLISEIGTPHVIATDVNPAPELVRKISRIFHARIYTPIRNMSRESKMIIGKDILNPHIRDAYAAAIKAYRKYKNRFKRIETVYPERAEQYKELILKGYAIGKLAKD